MMAGAPVLALLTRVLPEACFMSFFLSSLDQFARSLAPKLLALLLIVVSFLPVHLTGISFFMPLFDIMIIYYWSIYNPKLFPRWFVLLMGILQDILCGLPLGITALSNLLLREVIVSRRRFFIKEPFMLIWLSFALFSFAISCLRWGVATIVLDHAFPIEAPLMQWLLTATLYTCMHWLFNKLYILLPVRNYAKIS
jgi:rod shape-determining protein MreD